MKRQMLGALGEKLAEDFLKKKGYSVVTQNFRSKFGEIDLTVKNKDTTVFVEVKTRINTQKGEPYEAVTYRKKLHLKKAIEYYLINHPEYKKLRSDVISIILSEDLKVTSLKHFENIDTWD